MKTEINITDTDDDLGRFENIDDLRHFFLDKGIDGLELMPCMGRGFTHGIEPKDIVGVHLRYYPSWVDFWKGDTEALDKEYGTRKDWEMYYGGSTREAFLEGFRKELAFAKEAGAQYVVFHVAESALEECLTYEFRHTDMEVCLAAAEVINALMDGQDYDFYFLVENLWWSGMNLMDNAATQALLDAIHYKKKGIILDTGHLLNTNRDLTTQDEGVAYIHQVLDHMGPLTSYIKGMHLNQSLSGAYVKQVTANPPELTGTYWEKLSSLYPHIFHIDYHEPFTAPGVAGLIRRIGPEFVTYELITRDRRQHEERLTAQLQALKENGGIR